MPVAAKNDDVRVTKTINLFKRTELKLTVKQRGAQTQVIIVRVLFSKPPLSHYHFAI